MSNYTGLLGGYWQPTVGLWNQLWNNPVLPMTSYYPSYPVSMVPNCQINPMTWNYQNVSMLPNTDLRDRYWSTVGDLWKPVLLLEFYEQYFINLCDFLTDEKSVGNSIYPPEEEVFDWTQYCSTEDVKVVIIGRDPYPGAGKAHGLSFSVKGSQKLTPSLKYIYDELDRDFGFLHPRHGDLTSWANQGVLLLNSCLTVRAKKPQPEKPKPKKTEPEKDERYKTGSGSHENQGWEILTNAVIRHLNDNYSNIVFMLWGAEAQKKKCIINQKEHLVLYSDHPAYPSPTPGKRERPFVGCKHFSQANEYLLKHRNVVINWTRVPPVLPDTFMQPVPPVPYGPPTPVVPDMQFSQMSLSRRY